MLTTNLNSLGSTLNSQRLTASGITPCSAQVSIRKTQETLALCIHYNVISNPLDSDTPPIPAVQDLSDVFIMPFGLSPTPTTFSLLTNPTRYAGPYQVVERVGDVAYRLQLPEGARVLKPFIGSPPTTTPPLPPLQHGRLLQAPEKVFRS
jgi:hypothetical protein